MRMLLVSPAMDAGVLDGIAAPESPPSAVVSEEPRLPTRDAETRASIRALHITGSVQRKEILVDGQYGELVG
jgi:hypothetical protein